MTAWSYQIREAMSRMYEQQYDIVLSVCTILYMSSCIDNNIYYDMYFLSCCQSINLWHGMVKKPRLIWFTEMASDNKHESGYEK